MATQDHETVPGNAMGGSHYVEPQADTQPTERLAASVGKDTAHGDVSHYQRAKAFSSGEKPGGGSGFGMLPGDDDDEDMARFDTDGGNDESAAPDYSTVDPDSNRQAGGRELGA